MPSDRPVPTPIGPEDHLPGIPVSTPAPIPAPPEKSMRIWPWVVAGVAILVLMLVSCGALFALGMRAEPDREIDEDLVEMLESDYPDYEISGYQHYDWETGTDHQGTQVTLAHAQHPFYLSANYERTRYRDSDRWTEWNDPYSGNELFKVGGTWERDNPEGFIKEFARRHRGEQVICLGVWPEIQTLEHWDCDYVRFEGTGLFETSETHSECYELDRSEKVWTSTR